MQTEAIQLYEQLGQCFSFTLNSSPVDALAMSLMQCEALPRDPEPQTKYLKGFDPQPWGHQGFCPLCPNGAQFWDMVQWRRDRRREGWEGILFSGAQW